MNAALVDKPALSTEKNESMISHVSNHPHRPRLVVCDSHPHGGEIQNFYQTIWEPFQDRTFDDAYFLAFLYHCIDLFL